MSAGSWFFVINPPTVAPPFAAADVVLTRTRPSQRSIMISLLKVRGLHPVNGAIHEASEALITAGIR